MTPDDRQADGVEHVVELRSVQEYTSELDPEFIDENGELKPHGTSLEFNEELSFSAECSCGRRFLKRETAVEHLAKQDTGVSHGGGDDGE